MTLLRPVGQSGRPGPEGVPERRQLRLQAVPAARDHAPDDKLKEYAGKLGLDVARWEKDYNSPEIEQEIKKDMTDGQAADVSGTPTFFVNGKRAMTRSFDGFKDMIDAALKSGDKQGG